MAFNDQMVRCIALLCLLDRWLQVHPGCPESDNDEHVTALLRLNAAMCWLTAPLDVVQPATGGQHQSPSLSLGELRNELRTFAATLNE